jgi:ABC-type lipoprotein release transport system permease subunit
VIVGFVVSYWTTTIFQQFLYQIDPRDPWVYAGVAVLLIATGVLAAWVPAWRASRLDPSVVLRAQ